MSRYESADWRELCREASQECDPKKLLELMREINRALSLQRGRSAESQPSHA
jgi:hypothetical protein